MSPKAGGPERLQAIYHTALADAAGRFQLPPDALDRAIKTKLPALDSRQFASRRNSAPRLNPLRALVLQERGQLVRELPGLGKKYADKAVRAPLVAPWRLGVFAKKTVGGRRKESSLVTSAVTGETVENNCDISAAECPTM